MHQRPYSSLNVHCCQHCHLDRANREGGESKRDLAELFRMDYSLISAVSMAAA